MALADITCCRCGRSFKFDRNPEQPDYPEFGCLVDGDVNWEDECTHCHTCLYDDCAVYLNKPEWWCDDCCASTST